MSSRLKFKTIRDGQAIKKIEILQLENKRLTKENEELKARLAAYENGVPVGDGDKSCEYYFKDNNHLTRVKWSEKHNSWVNSLCHQMDYKDRWIKTLYPLPPTQAEGEE